MYACAATEEKTKRLILRIVNAEAQPADCVIQLSGLRSGKHSARAVVLAGGALTDVNSFEQPTRIAPSSLKLAAVGPEFSYSFKPYSFSVRSI